MDTFSITLRSILRVVIVVVVLSLFVSYVLYQSRLLLGGPHLEFIPEPPFVVTEPYVTLEGLAENIVRITINDSPIETTERGNFSERVMLTPGYSIIKLEAYDRYGRKEQLTRSFVYSPLLPIIEPNQPSYGNEESDEEGL